MKMTNRLTKKKNRVDYQVSIIVIGILILSFICVYFFNYYFTYNDMVYTLKERSNSIYEYVDTQLDKSTFYDINNKEDMTKESYIKMKESFSTVKSSSGVRYLYTAKKNDNGKFIYVVDGLPDDSPDFRYPGDAIEEEIIPELTLALENKTILPDSIKETDWGNIFISYYPIHDKGEVVGAIGIEFDADHQYQTFKLIRFGTPMIGVSFCLLAIGIAVYLFRRISNPTFKDFANTDSLTGLKNRNAFDVVVNNIRDNVTIGIILADLNNLKQINDDYGHHYGDVYIQEAAKVLIMATEKTPNTQVYRVGGDEFAILINNQTTENVHKIISVIRELAKNTEVLEIGQVSIALGMSYFIPKDNISFMDKYNEADKKMYEDKKSIK